MMASRAQGGKKDTSPTLPAGTMCPCLQQETWKFSVQPLLGLGQEAALQLAL